MKLGFGGRLQVRRWWPWVLLLVAVVLLLPAASWAQQQGGITIPRINIGIEKSQGPEDVAVTLQILLLFTILTLAPSFLVLMTSFTRITIVISFLRKAAGTQNEPPNQVAVAIALFLTLYIMTPVFTKMYDEGYKPYMDKQISVSEAVEACYNPLRDFMLGQVRDKDLALFVSLSRTPRPKNTDDIPWIVLIPAFVTSELMTAFTMGFLIYIPFLIVDMVIASVLMSMGMMMLPPAMISAPFKILLFVLSDGWHLIMRALVISFR